ncbi:nucleotide 5'-monophosphate nucleosidase PpnN [Psychrobium sp. 1_MG-2023]|uniref:nucleotide 5'-monophosphate nucleosidase PpnN n=1 Tax=Psychrobium sp. 1_MG-2023 TaxID=3062624 RepID=UPI000C332767|nr:nucleotide 5'-monophosphate nucleosidase PpnN [Psychrobium sp. 1_MG-2023]MDP2560928.1 nucleotide 5'-monophosphate nucleosidase PpnN [Psychrobium sp. 1_MG-2023]PKF56038.1 LOG family protein [Alteromonadales bacterium alter-6D02]
MIIKISPRGSLEQLSQIETAKIQKNASSRYYQLYRKCALAILCSGIKCDDAHTILTQYPDFDINVITRERGVQLELINPPQQAFVDDEIIIGLQEHLFSALRDIVYLSDHYYIDPHSPDSKSQIITNRVFRGLRNAKLITDPIDPSIVVCWGGHSISDAEYQYTRDVGYELGLRHLNICTGCGPGAMEGPMKGATIGHAKQRVEKPRYIGLTEPSIIAAEPPNQLVNELVIMPDIEKRLEAFIRIGHGIIIFPGGPGTAEELLYLLGILLDANNENYPFPLVLTGPKESKDYFASIDRFINDTLGKQTKQLYRIIIDDPKKVARVMKQGMLQVRDYRKQRDDSYRFNWGLNIPLTFQTPFIPSHRAMSQLKLDRMQSAQDLASNLRCAFSGIVAGNVKYDSIKAIKQHGLFQLSGDPELMKKMDQLLSAFVAQNRMKLPHTDYQPCYEVLK